MISGGVNSAAIDFTSGRRRGKLWGWIDDTSSGLNDLFMS